MISPTSKCVRNLKVGDEVIVKLLPYHQRYKTFHEPIKFPIIGFNQYKVPLIGTMSQDLYNHHHFITTRMYYALAMQPGVMKWTYCMRLDEEDIEIQRIIKHRALPKSTHL